MRKILLYINLSLMLWSCNVQDQALVKQLQDQNSNLETGIVAFQFTGKTIDSLLQVLVQMPPNQQNNSDYQALYEKVNGQHNKFVATLATAKDLQKKNQQLLDDYLAKQVQTSEAKQEATILFENTTALFAVFNKMKIRSGGLSTEVQQFIQNKAVQGSGNRK